MQPSSPSPTLTPTRLSSASSPCQMPEHLTAATLVLVNKPDTHFYPVFHVQKDPPPDLSGMDTGGNQITAYDQIVMGSDINSDLRMFFAEPKHCSLIVDSMGKLYILNFSLGNPCLLNKTVLPVNTLHALENSDLIHVAGKDFRVDYKPGYPISPPTPASEELMFFDTLDGGVVDLEVSDEKILECVHPQGFATPPKTGKSPLRSTPRKEPVPKSPQASPERYITHSSPAKSFTPISPKKHSTPARRRGGTPHDATDNSCTSMEVNTSQPSLEPRDISTTIDTPLEPRNRNRRQSEVTKKALSSPVKLKRRSAPVTRVRVSPRLYNLSMNSSGESPGLRISGRNQTSPIISYVKKSHKNSPKPSLSICKHASSTSPPKKRSKSPDTLSQRKSVRFGPALSPEEFFRHMPPSTPVKRGSTPKSATKAVLRRSTPYKVLPSGTPQLQKTPKSKITSPERFSPRLSPKLFTPKSPKLKHTLSPVKEVQAATLPTILSTHEPMLRRGFSKAVLSEIVETHTLKLSSRISTPTSLHSQPPKTFSDTATPTNPLRRRVKVPALASQTFRQRTQHNSAVKMNSKAPETLLEVEYTKVQRRSPRLGSPPTQDTPLSRQVPRKANSPKDSLSPKFSTPFSTKLSLGSDTPTPSTPRYSEPPKSVEHSRNNSTIQSPRVSKRVSKSPDTFQSPLPSATKRIVVTPAYSFRESTSIALKESVTPLYMKRSPAVTEQSPATQRKPISPVAVTSKLSAVQKESTTTPYSKRTSSVTNMSPAVTEQSPALSKDSATPAYPKRNPDITKKSPKQSPAVQKESETPPNPKRTSNVANISPAVVKNSPAIAEQSPILKESTTPPYPKRSPAAVGKSPVQSPAVQKKLLSPVVQKESTTAIQKEFTTPSYTKRTSNVTSKYPAAVKRSPAVTVQSPAIQKKLQSLVTANRTKSPAVQNASSKRISIGSPTVPADSPPAVPVNYPAVTKKSPAVSNKSPAVSKRAPAVPMKSPIQTVSALSKSPGKRSSTGRRSSLRPRVTRSEISPDFERSIVYVATTPAGRPRSSSKSRASTPGIDLSSRLTSRSSSSVSPMPDFSSPRRGRSLTASKAPLLVWVSPTRTPTSAPKAQTPASDKEAPVIEKIISRMHTPKSPSRRSSTKKEDAFNPQLFKTPKNRNRTSQAEGNFESALFDAPQTSRAPKRSRSAPHDTPTPVRRSKRSASLPVERHTRKKHTAPPEDAFVPYMFRTPRTKPVHGTARPEDNCMPELFKSPPTPVGSESRGVKRPASQRGRKTPTKSPRQETHEPPQVSPLVIRETRRKKKEVEKVREVNKRVITKEAPSSPAKLVLINSPPKSPVTTPFLIRTSLRELSPSPLPVRVTRNRTVKNKKSVRSPVALQKYKIVKHVKTPSPVKKPVTPEITEIDSSPSPPPLRVLRERKASSKPVSLAAPVVPNSALRERKTNSKPASIIVPNVPNSPSPVRVLRERKASSKPVQMVLHTIRKSSPSPLRVLREGKASSKPVWVTAPGVTNSSPPVQVRRVLRGERQAVTQTQEEAKGILKTPSRLQDFSKVKVSVTLSPKASKLSSPKRTRGKVAQAKTAKVTFAETLPKPEVRKSARSQSPIPPENSTQMQSRRSTRLSRAK